ncbi:hypothetical protein GM418_14000 [Maribellus comscasis]|uniref:Uncharacterized protein n=1 Tax=Maribellus comscasis TaxID=2681766 RepID=A0A6I6JUI9_9BACT|nr:hypothetical protein [Maribellus comscasis]QGY44740.1 hypothetical protein GM418_14000 [Maribellus comscasis]
MDNLEHKIREAFSESDAKTTFAGKEKMWNRIDITIHRTKSVAAWWRVAAVFLFFFFAAGVYAAFTINKKQQSKLESMQSKNVEMQNTIDSLIADPVQTKTETKVVEKLVYRDRFVPVSKSDNDSVWRKKFTQLEDSTQALLAVQKMNHQIEKETLEAELKKAKDELFAFQKQKKKTENKGNEPFQLKSERVEMGVQSGAVPKNSALELKVFPGKFTENKNDLNRTLLKNK